MFLVNGEERGEGAIKKLTLGGRKSRCVKFGNVRLEDGVNK